MTILSRALLQVGMTYGLEDKVRSHSLCGQWTELATAMERELI
ncbi:hypothetical protein PN498_00680 [Oscillatoria sp. CS-180]|nr:hypothetical protein [Oscillatoria sp. CS-180]